MRLIKSANNRQLLSVIFLCTPIVYADLSVRRLNYLMSLSTYVSAQEEEHAT